MRPSHVALIALLAFPATVPAQDEERSIDRSRHLWSTVNACDTDKKPNTVGLRASMPGSGRKKERMDMRFRVQFKLEDGTWKDFSDRKATSSGWLPVGSARYKARQSGWDLKFQPDAGQRFEVRGVVNFRWRRGDKIVRRATKATTPGHNVTVADPDGYSAATCEILG